MDKVWDLLDYPEEKLVKDVMTLVGVNKSTARALIDNGVIRPSATKTYFRFYVKGYKYPILNIKSEELMNTTNGIIDNFLYDYKSLREINSYKENDTKKIQVKTAIGMKHIYGKPKMFNDAIYEIKTHLINAKVDYIEAPRIVNKVAQEYHKLLKEFDLRLGRGIFGDWGTIRLILKWAERINFEEYVKIRNSFKLEEWENMIKFETALSKKRPEYEPVGVLEKDKYFAHIFQYDILRDVIEDYDDISADRLVISAAWATKNIFKYLHKADWLGVANLWVLAKDDCWISSRRMAKPERFRQEYNIPKRSFYRQRDKFLQFIERRLPGQTTEKGLFPLDPPTFLDIF